ncbi:ABC transporter permease [Parabacteroides sp. OttesenSCG-928-K15]|nr:ABC transporter permease [Parabacteroides sp. OttesenSCG-928-K15]
MKIILLAIRSLSHFRMHTFINIFGLALSLICVIVISRYVHREVTTDHFINDLDRVYATFTNQEGHDQSRWEGCISYNPQLKDDASIEVTSAFISYFTDRIGVEKEIYSVTTFIVESNFLKIINLPVISSSVNELLTRPDEAVVTTKLAQRLFGNEDPIGKTIRHSTGKELVVTGVLGEASTQFSFLFDLLVSDKIQENLYMNRSELVKLLPGTDWKALNKQWNHYDPSHNIRTQLFPLKKMYFGEYTHPFILKSGNRNHIFILLFVSVLILAIGLFNFINIYTVLMLKRKREFGMKKVFGANAKEIAVQLYMENLFMTAIALFLAWVVIEVTTVPMHRFLGIPLETNASFSIAISLGILFLLPFITSVYPFLRFNYSLPVTSLRAMDKEGKPSRSRAGILSFQYVLSIFLVTVSLFFVKQLHFMLHTDVGYNTQSVIKASVLSAPLNYYDQVERERFNQNSKYVQQALAASPLFTSYYFGYDPSMRDQYEDLMRIPGQEYKKVQKTIASIQYFETLGIKLKEGHLWDENTNYDCGLIVINESAKRLFGITDIENAELQPESSFIIKQNEDKDKIPPSKVIGVVEDYKWGHLSQSTPPMVFEFFPAGPGNSPLIAQIVPGRHQEAIAFLKQIHQEVEGTELQYSFLDDEVKALYNEDRLLSRVLITFAILAVLICLLGLFGLSLHDIQQRYPEIAIRKINGATSSEVMQKLLTHYLYLLGISFLIALPVSFFAINRYLETFAHKTATSWWIFATSLVITAGTSLLVLIWQVRKAAMTNPAEAIKME